MLHKWHLVSICTYLLKIVTESEKSDKSSTYVWNRNFGPTMLIIELISFPFGRFGFRANNVF